MVAGMYVSVFPPTLTPEKRPGRDLRDPLRGDLGPLRCAAHVQVPPLDGAPVASYKASQHLTPGPLPEVDQPGDQP